MATKIIANPKATGEKEERITPKDVEDIKIQLDTLRSLLASRISATSQVQVNPVKDLDSVLRSLPAGKRIVTLAERHIGERVVFGARAVMTDKNWKGPWDSSEFVGWVIYQATGLIGRVPSGRSRPYRLLFRIVGRARSTYTKNQRRRGGK